MATIDRSSRPLMTDGLAVRAVRFMEDNVGQRFNVDFVVRKLGVSRRTLERAFSQAFGETPHARLMRIRGHAARRALEADPGRTLASVARTAGFSSVRHLRRALDSLGTEQPSIPPRSSPGGPRRASRS